MKNSILLIGFAIIAFTCNISAQTCSHGSASAESKSCTKPSEAAIKAASLDPSIEMKTCKGKKGVCFVRKSKDAQGMVSTEPVTFDEAKAQFVSVSDMGSDGKTGKSCSASKACCAKGGSHACCKAKSSASVQQAPLSTEDIVPAATPSEQIKTK